MMLSRETDAAVAGAGASADTAAVVPTAPTAATLAYRVEEEITVKGTKLPVPDAHLTAAAQESDDVPSVFSNTGELTSTGIPQRTFAAAVALLFITTVLALYLIVTLSASANSLGTAFLSQQLLILVLDIVVWTVTGILTLVHSTSMRLPLQDNILLPTARWVFSVGSLVCAIATFFVIFHNKSYNAIMGTSDDSGGGGFCETYSSQYCHAVWNLRWEVDEACQHCYNCRYTYSYDQCYNGIVGRLQHVTVPLLIISLLAVFSSLFTLFELVKFGLAA